MNNILFTVFTFSPNVTVNTSIRTFAIDGITLCIVYTISATIPHAFSPEMSRWTLYKRNAAFKIFTKIRFWILMIKHMFALIFNHKCLYLMSKIIYDKNFDIKKF